MKIWLARLGLWLGLVSVSLLAALLIWGGPLNGFALDAIGAGALVIVLGVWPIKGKARKSSHKDP